MASIKQEFRKFGETVSVRGVPRILKTDDRILCTAWLVCVLASTAILVWQLTILFIKYYEWPVTTTYSEQWKETPTFPDVTMCNLYPLSRELNHALTWNQYINITQAEKVYYPYNESLLGTWKINDSFPDFSQEDYDSVWNYYIQQPSGYFRNLPVTDDAGKSASCPSFVIDCSFVDTQWQQSTSLNCMEFVSSFWDSQYFQCYTIHLNESLKQTIRGLTTVLNIDDFPQEQSLFSADLSPSGRGARVAVHSPGTKPDLKRGISVGPGTETTVKIAQTIRQRLSKPYSGSDCSTMKYLPGSHTELYTYDACFDTCVQQQIVDACKCVSEFCMYTKEQLRQGNNKLCGNQSLLANASNYMDPQGLIDLWCSFAAYDSSDTDKCDNQCFFPCYENVYDTAVSSSPWPHLSYHLNFYQRYIGECIDDTYRKKFDEYNKLWMEFYPDGFETTDQATKINVTQKLRQLSLIEDNFLQINFVIDNNKPYSLVDKPSYSIEQMISLVGGCLSLWLGITVMTAVEVVEFLYSLLLACKQKCGRKDGNDEGDPNPPTANAGIPMQTDHDAWKL